MSLLKTMNWNDSAFHPYLNTNTLFDIQTGVFVPGSHGGMILNGGLGLTNSVMGRPQMFKSTVMFSFIMRVLSYYPESISITDDTEDSLKKDRIVKFSPYNDNHNDLYERNIIQTPVDTTAEEFFEKIKKTAEEKLKHKSDYLVESPILDPRTNSPLMMLIPTLINYDSWSAMISSSAQNIYDTKQIGSSDTNIVYMRDANVKKMMISQIPTLAARAGMYFSLSAHVGEKYELNPYAQSPKTLQYMRTSDKPKGVGNDFNFLISNSLDMRSVKVLLDGDKECQYPLNNSGGEMELNEVIGVLCRCKNNMSGTLLPMVVSQANGVLGDLSNYHYLKENKYFGFTGSPQNHKLQLTNCNINRNTIREKLLDPKITRAIEILAQLLYIQSNWMPSRVVDFSMSPEVLTEKLIGCDGPNVNDILESRGWWTYDKKNKQPYMSLFDILSIAQGIYKAKGISLVGLSIPINEKENNNKKVKT